MCVVSWTCLIVSLVSFWVSAHFLCVCMICDIAEEAVNCQVTALYLTFTEEISQTCFHLQPS